MRNPRAWTCRPGGVAWPWDVALDDAGNALVVTMGYQNLSEPIMAYTTRSFSPGSGWADEAEERSRAPVSLFAFEDYWPSIAALPTGEAIVAVRTDRFDTAESVEVFSTGAGFDGRPLVPILLREPPDNLMSPKTHYLDRVMAVSNRAGNAGIFWRSTVREDSGPSIDRLIGQLWQIGGDGGGALGPAVHLDTGPSAQDYILRYHPPCLCIGDRRSADRLGLV
jgi:hypothetical protein